MKLHSNSRGLKVNWSTKPTKQDKIGCDGLYIESIELAWWKKVIVFTKAFFKYLTLSSNKKQ